MASTDSAVARCLVHCYTFLFPLPITESTANVTVLFRKAAGSVASGHVLVGGFSIPLILLDIVCEIFVVVDFVSVKNNLLNVGLNVLALTNGLLYYGCCVDDPII